MDVVAAKSAIVREVTERLKVSGGVEAFRRLVGGRPEVVERALDELAAEGWLKEVPLRVGKIYFYPPNVKPSQALLYQALRSPEGGAAAREAPARRAPGAAPPAAPPSTATLPAAAPPTAPAPSTEGGPAFSGPVKARKKSEIAAEAAALPAGGSAPATPLPVAAPPSPPPPAAAPGSPVYTGPVRAKKKSDIAAEAGAAPPDASASPAEAAPLPAPPPSPAPAPSAPVYTGPVKAKKKSEIAAELAAAAPGAAAVSGEPPPTAPAAAITPAALTAPPLPSPEAGAAPVYTGPVKAKKQSQLAAKAAAGGMVLGTEPAQATVQPDEPSAAVTAAVADPGPPRELPEPPVSPADAPKVYTGPIRAKKKSEGG